MEILWVKRTDASSYFPVNFRDAEAAALEAIPGVRYLGVDDAVPATGSLVLLTNTHTQLSRWEQLRPRVQLLLHPNSGMDNLMNDLAHWNTPVVLGNPIRATAVSEWVMGCLWQHFAPVNHHSVWPKGRQWERKLLREQRVLLVGHGQVGKRLESALLSLGVALSIHDPFERREADLLAAYDVVILAASKNPSSKDLLGKEFFARASREVLIINPARGELVDEAALRTFLKHSPQARAYLDVHSQEPYPSRFWDDCPQVTATPHIAGVWDGLVESMIAYEASVVRAWRELSGDQFAERFQGLFAHDRKTDQGWYR